MIAVKTRPDKRGIKPIVTYAGRIIEKGIIGGCCVFGHCTLRE